MEFHYYSGRVGEWGGGGVVEKETKIMLFSTQLKLELKLELSLAIKQAGTELGQTITS